MPMCRSAWHVDAVLQSGGGGDPSPMRGWQSVARNGTLSKIGMARRMGRHVVALSSWRAEPAYRIGDWRVHRAGDPREAAAMAPRLAQIGPGRTWLDSVASYRLADRWEKVRTAGRRELDRVRRSARPSSAKPCRGRQWPPWSGDPRAGLHWALRETLEPLRPTSRPQNPREPR